MFSSTGCFSKITCPLNDECALLNCIFLHTDDLAQRAWLHMTSDDEVFQPPSKRQRFTKEDRTVTGANQIAVTERRKQAFVGALVSQQLTPPADLSDGELDDDETLNPFGAKVQYVSHNSRPISPPPLRRDRRIIPPTITGPCGHLAGQLGESLNPRKIPHDPAGHASRLLYLKKLHEGMVRLNEETGRSEDSDTRALKLTDARLIKLALDEEEHIARESPAVYANIIKLRMVAYKKMSLEQWKVARLEANMKAQVTVWTATAVDQSTINPYRPLDTGLSTAEEIEFLPHLFANQEGMQQFGYMTSPPSEQEMTKAREGVEAAHGWEQCERCKARFQVFPDRREDGALTSGGRCTYHWGRATRPPRDPTNIARGHQEKVYSCCNESQGTSIGCTTADSHVFKIYDGKRLASILQYERTPENPDVHHGTALAFDCEMAFTVNGMELIRITATAWPGGEELLDVLVRPLGAILDLNTRYSGIRPDDFAEAVPYDASEQVKSGGPKPSTTVNSRGNHPNGKAGARLRIVDSPVAARNLLFQLLSPSTPLIGHAIENDLNVTRIVHPCIIDTVLLFPHPGGLPLRRSLKALVKQLLWRDIQMGGASGHDSKEDARATGDLVREKVKRTWKHMRREGWTLQDGKFLPPVLGLNGAPAGPKLALLSGQKRTHDESEQNVKYD